MKPLMLATVLLVLPRPAFAAEGRDWRTPAEASEFQTTPRYPETLAYLKRLAAAAPRAIRIETFGKSGEGRDLLAVVASRDGTFDPDALHRAGRPIVLIQNAIHAGEMDGKDACLALLRDMVVTNEKAGLLRRVVVVVLPIYNVDGHERFGPYNRINQNGPKEAGWRTQARNLNLNRDYMKADAPETRAFLALWNRWLPDLFVDTHVSDGADFQYDVQYVLDSGPAVAPGLAEWQRQNLLPRLQASVTKAGYVIGPPFGLKDETDPSAGLASWPNEPRLSTGYAVLQNRVGVGLETHMLKDYRRRVGAMTEALSALVEAADRDAGQLVGASRAADAATIEEARRRVPVPLRLDSDGKAEPFRYRGYRFRRSLSEISGGIRVEYGREPLELEVPFESSFRVAIAVEPPTAYIVPRVWSPVIEVLEAHGLKILRTTGAWEGEVETSRCEGTRWHPAPYEGRQVLFWPGDGTPKSEATVGRCRTVRERLGFPAGSAIVPLAQRAAKVAVHFLEPAGPDSALAWGFFNAIFERKEYGEAYVVEGLARQMLDRDPKLKEEFERRLSTDREFAANPWARLDFFYRRSAYWDSRIGLYPVGRLQTLEGLPVAP